MQYGIPSTIAKLTVGVAVVLGACAPTTTLDQTWTSPSARTQPPLTKVVTIFDSDNLVIRRHGEDRLASDLYAKGVVATPGYMIFGDQDISDREAVKAKLRDMGYDGLVTMKIVDRENELEYSPGWDGYWGGWGWGGYWGPGGYWGGYAYTETIYRLETTAYSLRTGQVVWSALTKSVDPSGAGNLLDTTSKVIVGELTKRGLAG